ncbi:hypothetical protein D3C76_1399740 [compost metagenome]
MARLLRFGADFAQDSESVTKCFMEPLFLGANDFLDKFPFCYDISVVGSHDVANRLNQSEHKRFVESNQFSVAYRTAK